MLDATARIRMSLVVRIRMPSVTNDRSCKDLRATEQMLEEFNRNMFTDGNNNRDEDTDVRRSAVIDTKHMPKEYTSVTCALSGLVYFKGQSHICIVSTDGNTACEV